MNHYILCFSSVQIECFKSDYVFTGVNVVLESLPRSESSLLSVKLGGLFLRDLTTQDTIFPVLVSPKTVSSEVASDFNL